MSEELVLADGTRINTRTGRPVRQNGALPGYIDVPTHRDAQRQVISVRKRLADLPEVPEKMNIIAVVAAYYMFGLNEYETALAIGCTERQVTNIRMTEAFTSLIDAMTSNIVESQQDDVRTLIAGQARSAVNVMVSAMGSENEQVAVVAAKDILDRAGHRPVDVVEHRHRVEGGLTIEYVKKGGDDGMPTLELDAEDMTDV
jgi:hypothetical protein